MSDLIQRAVSLAGDIAMWKAFKTSASAQKLKAAEIEFGLLLKILEVCPDEAGK